MLKFVIAHGTIFEKHDQLSKFWQTYSVITYNCLSAVSDSLYLQLKPTI